MLRRAAEGGFAPAQTSLGLRSRERKQWAEAARWYRRSVEQGDPSAKVGLALANYRAQGVPRDRVRAFRLMLEAARTGDAVAQHNVGVMYERGNGTAKDLAKARLWLQRAADRGNEEAGERLASLPTESTDRASTTGRVMRAFKRSNVRAGPGTSHTIVQVLAVGERVRVIERRGNWFRLQPRPGKPDRFVYAPLARRIRIVQGGALSPAVTTSPYRTVASGVRAPRGDSLGVTLGSGKSRRDSVATSLARTHAQSRPAIEFLRVRALDIAMCEPSHPSVLRARALRSKLRRFLGADGHHGSSAGAPRRTRINFVKLCTVSQPRGDLDVLTVLRFTLSALFLTVAEPSFSEKLMGKLVLYPEGCQSSATRICKLASELTYTSSRNGLVWKTNVWSSDEAQSRHHRRRINTRMGATHHRQAV